MESNWNQYLNYNPVPILLDFGNPFLIYFIRRYLINENPGKVDTLWDHPELIRLLKKQNSDGSWSYPKRKNAHPTENYHILKTYRNLSELIECYGMDKTQSAVSNAAEYLLGHQSLEGDIRGLFGSQYAPHYSAGILELLIKAGYEDDPRIHKGIGWYLDNRQEDGGWAWPLRTARVSYYDAVEMSEPVKSDYSKPFSHALTGFVIRALAAHSDYRFSPIALHAGELLKSRFFYPDKYADRKKVDYWFKFQYPFWWANLLTSLDSLSQMGFDAEDPEIKKGLLWFVENQTENGLWPTGYGSGRGSDLNQVWVSYAICRVFSRFHKTKSESGK